jgi:hypothetical protein
MSRLPPMLLCAAVLALAPVQCIAQGAPAIYDAHGRLVGLWAGVGQPGGGSAEVISLRGFRFSVESSGRIGGATGDFDGSSYQATVWYTTVDCTGPEYLRAFGATITGRLPGGSLVRLDGPVTQLVYVPKVPSVSILTLRAAKDQGTTCIPQQPQNGPVVPFLPNDPSVTGVPNENFTPPLRLEVVPLSALINLFSDGFEAQVAQS